MAEKERDLRRTGEVRIDQVLSLKKPKSLRPRINSSLINYNFKKNESFLKPRQVRVPVLATPEQEAGARAIALTRTELRDLLASSATSNSQRTVTIMLRDGTFVRLPFTPLVQNLADRYHRTMDTMDRKLAESKKFPLKKIISPGVTLRRVGGVNVTQWPSTGSLHLKPLRRGKR